MARTINIPETTYEPGIITHEIGQFGNVDQLKVTMTRVPTWPGTSDQNALILSLVWDVGGGVSFQVPAGEILDKQGNVMTTWTASVTVPKAAGPDGQPTKRSVSTGTMTAEFLMTITTAVTIEAV